MAVNAVILAVFLVLLGRVSYDVKATGMPAE
jgi:hypothetical protein